MTQSLLAKLDELQTKVSTMAKVLELSRLEGKATKDQLEALRRENEQLHKKVRHTQGQIQQILNQWFPELELTSEE
jgi:predicted nuclease with TOPRIM domain